MHNPYTNDPATELQIGFVDKLGGDALHAHKLSKRECSAYIDELKASQGEQLSLDKPAPEPAAPLVPGVYETDEGVFVVKPNREGTRLYAKRLIEINAERANAEGGRVQIEFEYAPGAVFKLRPEDQMDLERAKELTLRYGRCINCGRHLKAAQSVEDGIGPKCKKRFKVGVAA